MDETVMEEWRTEPSWRLEKRQNELASQEDDLKRREKELNEKRIVLAIREELLHWNLLNRAEELQDLEEINRLKGEYRERLRELRSEVKGWNLVLDCLSCKKERLRICSSDFYSPLPGHCESCRNRMDEERRFSRIHGPLPDSYRTLIHQYEERISELLERSSRFHADAHLDMTQVLRNQLVPTIVQVASPWDPPPRTDLSLIKYGGEKRPSELEGIRKDINDFYGQEVVHHTYEGHRMNVPLTTILRSFARQMMTKVTSIVKELRKEKTQ